MLFVNIHYALIPDSGESLPSPSLCSLFSLLSLSSSLPLSRSHKYSNCHELDSRKARGSRRIESVLRKKTFYFSSRIDSNTNRTEQIVYWQSKSLELSHNFPRTCDTSLKTTWLDPSWRHGQRFIPTDSPEHAIAIAYWDALPWEHASATHAFFSFLIPFFSFHTIIKIGSYQRVSFHTTCFIFIPYINI